MLLIREFREEDWPEVHSYLQDPAAARARPEPPTEDRVRTEVHDAVVRSNARTRNCYELVLTLKDGGTIIGDVDLSFMPGEDEAELGINIAREWRGRGLGTEAGRAMVDFGFRVLGLRRIVGYCQPTNAASRRMLEKAGLRFERVWKRGVDAPNWETWPEAAVYAIERVW